MPAQGGSAFAQLIGHGLQLGNDFGGQLKRERGHSLARAVAIGDLKRKGAWGFHRLFAVRRQE